jgi:hypothetical protein
MFYHSHAYSVGLRDVTAAWLFCLAVAATGFAYAEAAATPDRATEARAAPQDRSPAAPRTATCDERKSPAGISRG